MRVLFWNIERGYKIQGILNILKKEKADIYLFTEVDRGVKRTNKKDFFEVLKKELKKDGVYEKLLIYDEEYYGRMTRFFVQDRSPSSAMFLDGDDLVFEYTKYYSLYDNKR